MTLELPGGCHCGAVRFRVHVSAREALRCNCSICTKKGFLHLIVPAAALDILRGEDALSEYRFGTRTARHLFCRTCGMHPFYVPRSHHDGFDVNVHCLDEVATPAASLDGPAGLDAWTITDFDGRHWEESIDGIR